MPSCRPDVIPELVYKVMEMCPETILDIGVGYGKWGALCIEYLKYWKNITPVVDGVEVFEDYKSPLHAVYDKIYYSNVMEVLPIFERYDLILLVDVIEHLSREDGLKLLGSVKKHYLVSTPAYWSGQQASHGNKHEEHLSQWTPVDFENSVMITSREGRRHIMGWK